MRITGEDTTVEQIISGDHALVIDVENRLRDGIENFELAIDQIGENFALEGGPDFSTLLQMANFSYHRENIDQDAFRLMANAFKVFRSSVRALGIKSTDIVMWQAGSQNNFASSLLDFHVDYPDVDEDSESVDNEVFVLNGLLTLGVRSGFEAPNSGSAIISDKSKAY